MRYITEAITLIDCSHYTYLELFRFSDTSMRVNVSHIDGSVSLVTTDATANSHAETFTDIFLNGNGSLGQLRSFQPQSTFQEWGHTLWVSQIWSVFSSSSWKKICKHLVMDNIPSTLYLELVYIIVSIPKRFFILIIARKKKENSINHYSIK